MDNLEQSLAGETGGVVGNRIIVLDVLHPDVPVIDLIDLPGIVTVNVNSDEKCETVERIISEQIAADREAGMTSFYLVVVPAGERPNRIPTVPSSTSRARSCSTARSGSSPRRTRCGTPSTSSPL
jgi:hypothetical protein